jgi:hypothetical protein
MMSIAKGNDRTADAMAAAMFQEDPSTALLLQATAADSRGDKPLAQTLVGEALDMLENQPLFGTHTAHFLPLAQSDARLARLAARTPDADRAKPALIAGCEGRADEAADLLAAAGLLPLAARMRLIAAEAARAGDRPTVAAAQGEQALAFFTSVGATRYADTAAELLQAVH